MFLNLNRGNRVTSFMGLQLPAGQIPKFGGGKEYAFIEVPLDRQVEGTEKFLRNQHVFVIPECKVNVRGDYHLLVEPNPALAEFGQVQAPYWIHSGEGEKVPGFWITLRRDLAVADIKYAIRLYLHV